MIKLTRAIDSIWVNGAFDPRKPFDPDWASKEPAPVLRSGDEDEVFGEGPEEHNHTTDAMSWNPESHGTELPAPSPEPPPVASGLDASWPESVGHPADFHPAFTAAGYELRIPRWNNGEAPSYSKYTEPPVEGGFSGSHLIRPSYDSRTPWWGLNTYGPWSGGVGHYQTHEDAIRAADEDRERYIRDFGRGR